MAGLLLCLLVDTLQRGINFSARRPSKFLGCDMLKAIKREIEECYELARGCAERRRRRPILNGAIEFLDMERRWLFLAHSYEFTERLGGSPVYNEFPGSESVQRRTARREEYQWEVSRIGGKAAKLLGIVYARDEEQAFQKAVEDLGITNPHLQKRLLIRRAA
jgi:hypothetical protein